MIVPGSSSFLKELRIAFYLAVKGRSILNKLSISDLHLWIKVIEKSMRGVSILKLILRVLILIIFTNASRAALGGFQP